VNDRLATIPGARIGVRYLLTSLGFWACFNLGTLLWHQQFQLFYFRNPYILALTHLAALGWLTTGLMGVMYATLPAALGVRPHSLRMAHVQYWLQVVGIAGLALTMSLVPMTRARVVCGLLTLGALVIFVHNMAATVGRGNAWHIPEAHFVMAVFYLAITGLIGMSYVFYLNGGYVPQTMVSLKVHAHFAGIGWLALTVMGLTYKLMPVELGIDEIAHGWSLAASLLINLVFWGVFFGYAYDWPALRLAAAALGMASVVCHTVQVNIMAQGRRDCAAHKRAFFGSLWSELCLAPRQEKADVGMARFSGSLPSTQASCLFGVAATIFALLLTTGVAGDSVAVEYAYSYTAGAGWFGLYVTAQILWLMPLLLHHEGHEQALELAWMKLALPGQVIGTVIVICGLLAGVGLLVALGASVNLATSLLVMACSIRLYRGQLALVES
jgi:hypothetical protein